ncbi:hypothetical protein E1176_17120 [Fulvivirga sp. RKSG066]|uniref:DUF4097 family beta strand repeat-containing protein n=1 Tax=Fulvivirga aurantia TaxID=2529383 RepID=UPI0012BB4BF7|nr:DUF4097 family beta strand repeat-containing protein [Fulvivirga aurantia]MTI22756.1 hypothetical protein [Fulvivirga aurantia]
MKSLAYSMIALLFPFVLQAQDEYKLNKEYEINLNGTLSLNTNDANVKITGSNRSNVALKVYRKITTKGVSWGDKSFSIEVEQKNGNLDIYEKSEGSHFSVAGYVREEYTIDIDVPLGISLDINGDDDDYLINNIKGSIALKLDDGDVELNNCGGSSFDFNADDADISMRGGSGSIKIRQDEGEVNIKNAAFSEIDATMDDGDMVIETSLASDGSYYFKADDGDIVLSVLSGGGNFLIDHDDSRLYTSGNFTMMKKDDNHTELKLGDGSALVKIRVDDASIRINSN